MLSSIMVEKIRNTLCSFWHYTDEEKVYQADGIAAVLRTMDALNSIQRFREAYEDDFAQEVLDLLASREKDLILTGDPAALRVPLWPADNMPDLTDDTFPGSPDGPDFRPFMIPWLLEDGKTHPAIIVISGGQRANRSEGASYCRFFNRIGLHAFQLGQRIEWGHKGAAVPNAALDLQRAIRTIRHASGRYHVDPDLIFAVGSSLGGVTIVHMLEQLSHTEGPSCHDSRYTDDAVDGESDRLNAMIGIYTSSYPNSPRNTGIDYSVYPPVFAVMGGSDIAVNYQLAFYNELVQNGVKVELHLFNGAVHGFGIGDSQCAPSGVNEEILSVARWPELAEIWINRVCTGQVNVGKQPFTNLKTSGRDSKYIQNLLYPAWPGYRG